jgi:hypothetical protein
MFDFRYHVVSLAAVFLALIIGILVGVAISDPGLADRTELRLKEDQIARLNEQLEAASLRSRQQEAATEFVEAGYEAVIKDRLVGKRIVLLFVGSVDQGVYAPVEGALEDAGADLLRLRALTVPIHEDAIQAALKSRAGLSEYVGLDRLRDLGRELGRELVKGGDTPLWDALGDELLEERRGPARPEADGVVVTRSAEPQEGRTARFLSGFYAGLEDAVPVVGVERAATEPSAIPVYRRFQGFSSVDSIDTRTGRVALAVLLAGQARGHFGVKETASAPIPHIDPVEPPADGG